MNNHNGMYGGYGWQHDPGQGPPRRQSAQHPQQGQQQHRGSIQHAPQQHVQNAQYAQHAQHAQQRAPQRVVIEIPRMTPLQQADFYQAPGHVAFPSQQQNPQFAPSPTFQTHPQLPLSQHLSQPQLNVRQPHMYQQMPYSSTMHMPQAAVPSRYYVPSDLDTTRGQRYAASNHQLQSPQLQSPQLHRPQLQSPQLHRPQLQSPQLQSPQLLQRLPQSPQAQRMPSISHPTLAPQQYSAQQYAAQQQPRRSSQQVAPEDQQRRRSSQLSQPQLHSQHGPPHPSAQQRQSQPVVQIQKSPRVPPQHPPPASPRVVIPIKRSASSEDDESGPPKPQDQPRTKHHKLSSTTRFVPNSDAPTDNHVDQVDLELVLLGLADQYITTARSMSSRVARTKASAEIAQYHELMRAGLACLDATIKNWTITDSKAEARLRLQYANLLHEETDNDDEAEAILSKGITICDRARLLDQKFSMQHLLVRIRHKKNPTAAAKLVESVLEVVVAYNNLSWIYVFRFLRVSLAMQSSKTSDLSAGLQQLRQIISLAESRRDVPVLVMAQLLEALLHTRQSTNESTEQAQRAIAAARAYQQHPQLEKTPQLRALIFLSDLSCDLISGAIDHLEPKVQALQEFIDKLGQDSKAWLSGNFQLPTNLASTEDLLELTSGILRTSPSGKISIAFRWLNKNELFMLGFLLSGVARLHKSCIDERAEKYLTEGIKFEKNDSTDRKGTTKSLGAASASVAREESLSISMQVMRVFANANRSNWTLATQQLEQLQKSHSDGALAPMKQAILYLDGVTKQAQGNLSGALECYNSPLLAIPAGTSRTRGANVEYRLLSTLNRIMILKSSPTTIEESQRLLASVASICQSHPDVSVQATADLLQAVTSPTAPVIKLKQSLQASLKSAQKVQNHQLLCMIMNLMVVWFFGGIIGDQAEKSATVGWQLSRRIRSDLWMSASGNNFANCLELHGKADEARKKRDDAYGQWRHAPAGILEHFLDGTVSRE